jgi:Golgi nucleoside diphosphatase
MAEVRELQVGFRKTVSDGNYGNEQHEARLTVTVAEGETAMDWLRSLSTMLEDHVTFCFKQSRNDGIRYAMETTEEREARYKREAEERKARLQQERAEREARLAAQAAAEAGSYFVGDDDEDAEDDDDDDE